MNIPAPNRSPKDSLGSYFLHVSVSDCIRKPHFSKLMIFQPTWAICGAKFLGPFVVLPPPVLQFTQIIAGELNRKWLQVSCQNISILHTSYYIPFQNQINKITIFQHFHFFTWFPDPSLLRLFLPNLDTSLHDGFRHLGWQLCRNLAISWQNGQVSWDSRWTRF